MLVPWQCPSEWQNYECIESSFDSVCRTALNKFRKFLLLERSHVIIKWNYSLLGYYRYYFLILETHSSILRISCRSFVTNEKYNSLGNVR